MAAVGPLFEVLTPRARCQLGRWSDAADPTSQTLRRRAVPAAEPDSTCLGLISPLVFLLLVMLQVLVFDALAARTASADITIVTTTGELV